MNTDKIYAEQIANEYAPKQTSKVKALKRLDAKAKKPATIFSFTFGIISSLVLGTGMSLAMKVIGNSMVLGIGIGLVGIALTLTTYPIFKAILKRRKNKYAPKIFELSDSLLNK